MVMIGHAQTLLHIGPTHRLLEQLMCIGGMKLTSFDTYWFRDHIFWSDHIDLQLRVTTIALERDIGASAYPLVMLIPSQWPILSLKIEVRR